MNGCCIIADCCARLYQTGSTQLCPVNRDVEELAYNVE
jgi:hypothetical protein